MPLIFSYLPIVMPIIPIKYLPIPHHDTPEVTRDARPLSPASGSCQAYEHPHWTSYGGFHSHGATPIAGWFVRENPIYKWMIWGQPYFRKPPYPIVAIKWVNIIFLDPIHTGLAVNQRIVDRRIVARHHQVASEGPQGPRQRLRSSKVCWSSEVDSSAIGSMVGYT